MKSSTTGWDDRLNWARLAMAIDCEGCIYASRYTDNRWSLGRIVYSVRIGIANTNLVLLDWVHFHFGGSINKVSRNRGNEKDYYQMTFGGDKAKYILTEIRPYLLLKQEQADLALRFLNGLSPNTTPLTKSVKKDRESIYLKMKELNKRGK